MGRTKQFFPLNIIQDHNAEGYDSVDSEDFDPGFGCVPVYVERVVQPPPPVIDNRTQSEKDNEAYYQQPDSEKDKMNDEFLKHYGI